MIGSNPPRRQSLSGAINWFAASYVLAIVGFLGTNALAARALGAEAFGTFVIVYTFSVVVGQVGLLGVHRAGVREVARLESFDNERARGLRDDVVTVSLTSLPFVCVLAGLVVTSFPETEPSRPLLLAFATGALIYLSGQQKLAAGYLRGLGHLGLAGLLEGRSGGGLIALFQAALLAVVVWFVPRPSLAVVILVLAAAHLSPVVWGHRVIRRHWPAAPRARGHRARLIAIGRRDWRFSVLSTVASSSQYVEVWVAGLVLTTVDSSYFSASHRLASLLVIPMASLQVICSPAISRLWARRSLGDLGRLARTAATLATLSTSAMLLVLAIAPDLAMGVIFGAGFEMAGMVLVVLGIGMLANVSSGLGGAMLSMTGHEGWSAAVTTGTLALRLGVGLWAGMTYGLMGLGIATATVTALHAVSMAYATYRLTGVITPPTLKPHLSLFRTIRG